MRGSVLVIESTKALYNLLWKRALPITQFDLPKVLSRCSHRKLQLFKRILEKLIDERPLKVIARNTFGHWESDTVRG